MVLLALFGAVMGQGVIWYTGQFYAQNFLETKAMLDFEQSRTIILWAILFGTPFFVVFGSLSDRIGRKWIMMIGMLLGILTYRPIYQAFLDNTDISTTQASEVKTLEEPTFKYESIKGTLDSLIFVSSKKQTANGVKFTEVRTDTLYDDIALAVHQGNQNTLINIYQPTYIGYLYYLYLFRSYM